MLTPELDKLRDKTLSFGCLLLTARDNSIRISRYIGKNYNRETGKENGIRFIDDGENIVISNIEKVEIIGHPLTRGRISHIEDSIENLDSHNLFRYIGSRLQENHLLGVSELERQTHAKRPELKELLIGFSNYF